MKKVVILIALLWTGIISSVNSQNSGPVAPEAASFEPIDATDMVDLLTGDFTYVLPLLEVPGSAGGYPISLHYHAGAARDLEASWVGLGWNLNPGSIVRSVNGVADDYKNKEVFLYLNDDGGSYEAWSVGVGVGINNVISIGVNVMWDSNKSVGGGLSVGVGGIDIGVNYGPQSGIGLNLNVRNINIGIGSNGASIGLSTGLGTIGYSTNSGLSFSTGFNLGEGNASVGLGISFSSKGVSVASSVLGGFSVFSSHTSMSDYTILESGWSIPIWTPWFSLNISNHKQRWFLKKLSSNSKYGSLYFYDIYDALDADGQEAYKNINMDVVEYSMVADVSGGGSENGSVLPAYDAYRFSAQGLNGYMSPRRFEEETPYLIGTGLELAKNSEGIVENEMIYYYNRNDDYCKKSGNNVQFYFDYENGSNLVLNNISDWELLASHTGNPFSDFTSSGGDINYALSDYHSQGNNPALTGRLVTGNYVEWFSNREISENPVSCRNRGFVDDEGVGSRLDETYFDPEGIGAFTIVKSDGLRYHYSLPVYQFEIIQKTVDRYDSKKYAIQVEPNKYATAWMLTAITGPDYYDANNDGKLNAGDYGYWVKFDYGKWTDCYVWKKEKQDNKFNYTTVGRKQIYYLNSIETDTHIAYFVKDIRKDAEGYTDTTNVSFNSSRKDYATYEYWEQGSHIPYHQYYQQWKYEDEVHKTYSVNEDFYRITVNTNFSIEYKQALPVLKLNKILLMNKAQSGSAISKGSQGELFTNINNSKVIANKKGTFVEFEQMWQCIGNCDSSDYGIDYIYVSSPLENSKIENYYSYDGSGYVCHSNNVYDVTDINSSIIDQAIKVVDLNYGSDLHIGHTNSSETDTEKKGKLALKSVEFLGKGGAKVMPAFKFDYYKAPENRRHIKEDPWGFPSEFNDDIHPKNEVLYGSLKEIQFPLGAKLKVNYKSDYYGTPSMQWSKIYKRKFDNSGKEYFVTDVNTLGHLDTKVEVNSIKKIDDTPNKFRFYYKGEIVERDGLNLAISQLILRDIMIYFMDKPGRRYHPDYMIILHDSFQINPTGGYFDVLLYTHEVLPDGGSNEGLESVISFGQSYYVEGELYYSYNTFFGGGLRTTSVELFDDGKCQSKTNYIYPNLGITAQVPTDVDNFVPFSGEVPAPGVYYDKVIVQNEGLNGIKAPLNTIYEFYLSSLYSNNRLGDILSIQDHYIHYSNNFETKVDVNSLQKVDSIPNLFRLYYQGEILERGDLDLNIVNVILQDVYINSYNNTRRYHPDYVDIVENSIQINPGGGYFDVYIYTHEILPDGSSNEGLDSVVSFGQSYSVEGKLNFTYDVVSEDDLINTYSIPYSSSDSEGYKVDVYTKTSELIDNKAAWGRLMSVTVQNEQGDVISRTQNNYLGVDEITTGQMTESYKYSKLIKDSKNKKKEWCFNSIVRKQVPNILKSVSTTTNGFTQTLENKNWDKYTGEVIETSFEDAMGNYYKTTKVPAYTIPAYSGMGPKALDASNANMLTQEAASYLYKIESNTEKVMSASVQTWNDRWTYRDFNGGVFQDYLIDEFPVWRKHKNYVWKGSLANDGSYDGFSEFDWNNQNSNETNGWQRTSEVTRYSRYSVPLEGKDINGQYSATKMTTDNRVLASGSNVCYTEFCFTGMEGEIVGDGASVWFGGEVRANAGQRVPKEYDSTKIHTGEWSYSIGNGLTGLIFYGKANLESVSKKSFRASIWVKQDVTPAIIVANNGTQLLPLRTNKEQFGDWYLLTADFDVPTIDFTISVNNNTGQTIVVDDFRVQPVISAVGSYVYNEFGQVTAILNNNNIATKYEYDKAGRLKFVYKETPDGFNKVFQHNLNFGETISVQ